MREVQGAGITDPAIVRKHGLHDIANLLLNATQILTALSEGHTSEGEVKVPHEVIHDIQVLRRVVATLANIATSLKEGKEIVRKEVFNLGDWVSDVVHALNGPSTQFLNIEFDCPETVMIYADKTAIWRAVHNILKNAIDVLINEIADEKRSDGNITVGVRLDSEKVVHITIRDDGPGIPQKIKDRLFQNGATTKVGEGHGYGLARSAEVMVQHSGILEVETGPQGTTFDMAIPQGDISDNQRNPKVELPEALVAKTKFIVLEDEAHIRQMFAETLEYFGVKVPLQQCATLGELRREIPNLDPSLNWVLILDGNFPEGTPLDAIRLIKEAKPDAKIIFSSGSVPEDEIRNLVDGVLDKPFNLDTLLAILGKINSSQEG